MPINGDIVHTVNFFQSAFTIILALALSEALKSFASEDPQHSLRWDRVPALVAFCVAFFPFFQGMSQYFYVTYLNPQTAPKFFPAYLIFDGVVFTLQAGCFFVMSRSLAPQIWRRFYGAVLVLLAIDICWAGITLLRGIRLHVWLSVDAVSVAALLLLMWFERGRPPSMRPAYIGLAIVFVGTALSYWLQRDIYFPFFSR